MTAYRLDLVPEPSGIPPEQRVKRLLKFALRSCGLRCTGAEELTPDAGEKRVSCNTTGFWDDTAAASIHLLAMRKLGELLRNSPKNKGTVLNGRDSFGGTKVEPPKNTPTMAESGVSKKLSSHAQAVAKMPALKLEPIMAAKAKESQKAGGNSQKVGRQISAQAVDDRETRVRAAKAAGVSHAITTEASP